ncbi:nucleotide exchange factor GrpE [Paractinoplanes maris]|uniref:nucleotide exchange factor GrpE n=1 Tax=Paractinoplanes maris TaxID=1734446 RepID=UPI002020206F|nr:nucleotide exchange factor GrpE [Actinoplanes maris]
MTFTLVGWRRRAAITAAAVIGAVAAYLMVMLLAPRPSQAEEVAQQVLAAAREGAGDRIAELLPEAGWADLTGGGTTVRYRAGRAPQPADGSAFRPDGPLTVASAVDQHSGWSVIVSVPAGGNPAWAAAAAAGAVLLTTVAVATVAGSPPPNLTPVPVDDGPEGRQRAAMIRSLADLVPQMPDALAWQATSILEAAGVRTIRPDGDRFDPAVHHAVGTEHPPDGQTAGVIARTIRPGYADGRRLVVHPRVVVFDDDTPADGARS